MLLRKPTLTRKSPALRTTKHFFAAPLGEVDDEVVAAIANEEERQTTAEVLRIVLVGVPVAVGGRLVGDRLFTLPDQRSFRGVVLGLLLVPGLLSLAQAVLGGSS